MTEILVAAIAAVIYVLISLAVGDRFPFSRYSMYADLTTRNEGAVLFVRAADRFIAPDDLEMVHGLDVDKLTPRGVPCSQEWLVHEAQRWLRSHSVDSPPADGIAVEAGWRMLRVEDGAVRETLRVMTRGTGRLRR